MKTKNIITEATEPKTVNENNNKNASPRLWQSVLVGGVPGIMIGMGGSAALEAAAASPSVEEQPMEALSNTEAYEVKVSDSVNDDMSFSEAFAAARKDIGAGGAFVWHGNVYGTYRGDDPEWLEMSAEDRAEHSRLIMSQVHRVPYTPAEDEPEIVELTEESESNVDETDIDVHIVGSEPVDIEAHAEFVLDGDGDIDAVLMDVTEGQDDLIDSELTI